MKAYAVNMEGHYWLAYAPNATAAKGLVIVRCGFYRMWCRRWPELDRTDDRVALYEWGYPGSRDYETGVRIETPEPFKAKEPIR